jgi:hypothetical protein
MTLTATKRSEAMKESWARRKAEGAPIKTRGKKKKGTWSKRARREHSIRMKERFAAKKQVEEVTSVQVESQRETSSLTITQRLDLIVGQIGRIREQIGGASGV